MAVKITVGVICRNEQAHIHKVLASIISQDFPKSDYEIIVVDGNSTDKTREIAVQTLKNTKIKNRIIDEKDKGFYGPCFARNLVIDNSSGTSRYIVFIDADCIAGRSWLKNLYDIMEKNRTSKIKIAGAGGPRLIAKTDDDKELIINAVMTSSIESLGNPAFSSREVEYIGSIPNYNAIYKKEVIKKFRYDDSLIVSDDNELNLRLKKAGYNFIYAKDSVVYHKETNSIMTFARNMFSYGVNIANTVRKHKSIVRISVPLTVIFILYLISIIPLYFLIGWMIFIPLILYAILLLLVFGEVMIRTKKLASFYVFILLPAQHICYGLGVIYNFVTRKSVRKL